VIFGNLMLMDSWDGKLADSKIADQMQSLHFKNDFDDATALITSYKFH